MLTPSEYLILHGVSPETGWPLGFAGYPFLRQILDDRSPRVVLMKGAQVGATTFAILRALWFVDVKEAQSLYLFPTHRSALRFSRGRLKTLLERSPRLGRLFARQRNSAHLRAGSVNLYCHGARSRTELLSMPIQSLTIDERDELYQADPYGKQPWSALELARQRLAGQKESWELNLSTPTQPGLGIAADYVQSDQHVFEPRCPKCGRWAALRWPTCVVWSEAERDTPAPSFRCIGCGGLWSDEEREEAKRLGRWSAQAPGAAVRGYHLPQLLSPALTAQRLVTAWRRAQTNPAALQVFHNSILGLPFAAAGERLPRAVLEAAMRRGGEAMAAMSDQPCALGADVGPTWLHVAILRREGSALRAVRLAKVGDWNELARLVAAFRVQAFVVDAQPETHQARRFVAAHPQGWLCWYGPAAGVQLDPPARALKAARTETLDALFEQIRAGSILLPTDPPPEFLQQMESLVRTVRTGRDGQARADYLEAGGTDHYAHALNYALLALKTLVSPVRFEVALPSGGRLAWE